eukprot:4754487-Prymnesium_polylepis.1
MEACLAARFARRSLHAAAPPTSAASIAAPLYLNMYPPPRRGHCWRGKRSASAGVSANSPINTRL